MPIKIKPACGEATCRRKFEVILKALIVDSKWNGLVNLWKTLT